MAAGDVWKKLRGTLGSVFQIEKGGVNIKNNAGVLEIRNPANSAYADARVKQIIVDDGAGHKVTINVPTLSADWIFTLPADDGSPAQVLTTDGSGVLSWSTVAGGTDKPTTDTTTLGFGSTSPLTLFTLPANAVIHFVKVIVDTAFNGTAPSLSIGITGTLSKYLASTEVDLKTVGAYEVDPAVVASGSTEALIATYSADSSSAGSARILVEYSIPS